MSGTNRTPAEAGLWDSANSKEVMTSPVMTTGITKKFTVGECFAGIGGISLGLEWTGGFETKWQIELDSYCTKVLEKHWPMVTRRRNIKRVAAVISRKLMSSPPAILASHSLLRESEEAKTIPGIFGLISGFCFAIFDHLLSSWKTSQATFQWDSDEFLETFPSSGMMRNGRCYRLPELERRISGGDCLFWPTPKASDSLEWGTPRTQAKIRKRWPTPLAGEVSGGFQSPEKRRSGGHTPKLRDEVGGQLNPTWVEWLMGYPLGHTELNLSETLSSRRSRKKSGNGF